MITVSRAFMIYNSMLGAILCAIPAACATLPPVIAQRVEAGHFSPDPDTGRIDARDTPYAGERRAPRRGRR